MSNPFADTPPSQVYSVAQLNRQVRQLLESHFDYVWVEGEVSNFAAPSSGHWYFSLKDGSAQVRCAMFRNRNQRLRFTPANGDELRLRCRVSLYEGRGEFQLIVEHAELGGEGALQLAFERLKQRLLAEGLFAPEKKKPLPDSITRLGVITSPTGAAIHDILTVLQRRCPAIEVYVLPVAVQGEAAASEICQAIARANALAANGKVPLDALIVGRGGGSLEDLWAFNEEQVARAIAASDLPIVSAVGHEVDFSIADLVADIRAATPSAAAELVSPDQREWVQRLKHLEDALSRQMQRKLALVRTELEHLGKRLKHPGALLREQSQRLDDLEQRLHLAQRNSLQRKRSQLGLLEARLQARSPNVRLQQLQSQLTNQQEQLKHAMQHRLILSRHRLEQLSARLEPLNPLATLQRGYAIITDDTGTVVTQSEALSAGDSVTARLADGSAELRVSETHPDNES
ncbi:MAG: exodeoxyribonuclease VII large subunit [Halieaceae bacterium]|nr:exodeoxyribonuclease VII large subunit [Halieaceae bacterium]